MTPCFCSFAPGLELFQPLIVRYIVHKMRKKRRRNDLNIFMFTIYTWTIISPFEPSARTISVLFVPVHKRKPMLSKTLAAPEAKS